MPSPRAADRRGRRSVLKLGGPRQRMVLATLLSRANHTISQDALIEMVWAGDPPEAARSTLHGEISRLAELRLVAVEARIDAELAAGNHAAVELAQSRLTRETTPDECVQYREPETCSTA